MPFNQKVIYINSSWPDQYMDNITKRYQDILDGTILNIECRPLM